MSVAAFLGFLFGVAAVTMLLSRVALLTMRYWDGGAAKLTIAHAISLAVCCALYLLQNPGAWLDWIFYGMFQALWWFIDRRVGWGYPDPARRDLHDVFR